MSRASRRTRRFFFFQAEDGIRDVAVTGVQTCALRISFHDNGTIVVAVVDGRSHDRKSTRIAQKARQERIGKLSIASCGTKIAQRLRYWLTLANRRIDRKSTRLNSSHGYISYAVFCLK